MDPSNEQSASVRQEGSFDRTSDVGVVTGPVSPRRHRTGLRVIAWFKGAKSVLLVGTSIGAFSLLHKDLAAVAARVTDLLRVDPNNRYLHHLLERFSVMKRSTLEELGIGSLVYAAVFAVESVDLFLEKRWAEYLTVIVTASLVPLEVYELLIRLTAGKIVVLAGNLVIIGYLVRQLRSDVRRKGALSTDESRHVTSESFRA